MFTVVSAEPPSVSRGVSNRAQALSTLWVVARVVQLDEEISQFSAIG